MAFSEIGLAVGGGNAVVILEPDSGVVAMRIATSHPVEVVRYGHQGRYLLLLVAVARTRSMVVFDLQQGRQVALAGGGAPVLDALLFEDLGAVGAVLPNETFALWDLAGGAPRIAELSGASTIGEARTAAMARSPDGEHLLVRCISTSGDPPAHRNSFDRLALPGLTAESLGSSHSYGPTHLAWLRPGIESPFGTLPSRYLPPGAFPELCLVQPRHLLQDCDGRTLGFSGGPPDSMEVFDAEATLRTKIRLDLPRASVESVAQFRDRLAVSRESDVWVGPTIENLSLPLGGVPESWSRRRPLAVRCGKVATQRAGVTRLLRSAGEPPLPGRWIRQKVWGLGFDGEGLLVGTPSHVARHASGRWFSHPVAIRRQDRCQAQFSRDGTRVASARGPREENDPARVELLTIASDSVHTWALPRHATSLLFGDLVLAAGLRHRLMWWDLDQPNSPPVVRVGGELRPLTWLPDDVALVVERRGPRPEGSEFAPRALEIWNRSDGQTLQVLPHPGRPITAACSTRGGRYLWLATSDGGLAGVDLRTSEPLASRSLGHHPADALAEDATHDRLVCSHRDGALRVLPTEAMIR